jgi:hypothetical protein
MWERARKHEAMVDWQNYDERFSLQGKMTLCCTIIL